MRIEKRKSNSLLASASFLLVSLISYEIESLMGGPSPDLCGQNVKGDNKGHFTHEAESPWPLHFKHSHCWKGGAGPSCFTLRLRDRRSKWMPRWMKSMHEFLHGIGWIMYHGHWDWFQKSPLGVSPNTKPGDHGTPNAHNRWFILFYHTWGPPWIEIY